MFYFILINVTKQIVAIFNFVRLTVFATRDDATGIPQEIKLFDIFSDQIAQIIQVLLFKMIYRK